MAAACSSPAPPLPPAPRDARPPNVVELAGSGGALLLASRLADAFRRAHPELRVVVHPSIGSSGAVHALADRAIDVGLLTRPPHAAERRSIGEVLELARTEVVLVAHPEVPDAAVGAGQVARLFAGRGRWADGSRAVPVMRETGDSSQEALADALPGLRPVLDRQWRQLRYRVVFHDADLVEVVSRLPGAFGPLDRGQVACGELPVRVLPIRGVRVPKRLFLALPHRATAAARAFLELAGSPAGRALVAACGYALPGSEG